MNKFFDLLSQIRFFRSKLNNDTEFIRLFRTSKTIYERFYPQYELQSAYPIKKLIHLLESSALLKPIITSISQIRTAEELIYLKQSQSSPSKLTHLTFGHGFNESVENLPSTLTHLTFGVDSDFNQPVEHLPSTLTHLTFNQSSQFNQPVDHLPSTITH